MLCIDSPWAIGLLTFCAIYSALHLASWLLGFRR